MLPDNLPKQQREAQVNEMIKQGIQPLFYKPGQRNNVLREAIQEKENSNTPKTDSKNRKCSIY